MYSGRW